MITCDLCHTTDAPSYYSPMNRGGVTLCCQCDKIWIIAWNYGIDFIDRKEYVLKDLLKLVKKIRDDNFFNLESLDRITLANEDYFKEDTQKSITFQEESSNILRLKNGTYM